MKIVLASSNEHKALEINKILSPYGIEVVTYASLNILVDDINENGLTFHENALIKAQEIAKHTSLPVLSDDSGLLVHALNDFPSIHTARFAKECNGYDNAMEELNKRLINKDTSASFMCVLCLVNYEKEPLYFIGEVKGHIINALKGDNGFGYDPCFVPVGYDKPFSLLDEKIKNTISHRYNALNKLVNYLKA